MIKHSINRFRYNFKISLRLIKTEKTIFREFFLFSSFFSALFFILCKFTFTILQLKKRQNKKVMETIIFSIFQANGAKSERNLLLFYKTLFFFLIILLISVLIIEGFYLFIHFQRYVQLKRQTIRIKQSLGIAPAKIAYELFKEHFLLLIFCSILGLILKNAVTKIFLSKLPRDIAEASPNYNKFSFFVYILFILVINIFTFCLTKRNLEKSYSSL